MRRFLRVFGRIPLHINLNRRMRSYEGNCLSLRGGVEVLFSYESFGKTRMDPKGKTVPGTPRVPRREGLPDERGLGVLPRDPPAGARDGVGSRVDDGESVPVQPSRVPRVSRLLGRVDAQALQDGLAKYVEEPEDRGPEAFEDRLVPTKEDNPWSSRPSHILGRIYVRYFLFGATTPSPPSGSRRSRARDPSRDALWNQTPSARRRKTSLRRSTLTTSSLTLVFSPARSPPTYLSRHATATVAVAGLHSSVDGLSRPRGLGSGRGSRFRPRRTLVGGSR